MDEATILAERRSRSIRQDVELSQTSLLGKSELDFNEVFTALYEGFSTLEDDLMSAVDAQTWSVGYALAMTTGLSAGYVLWVVRSGYMMTSVLSAIAPWMMADPLLVLDYLDDKKKHAHLDEHDLLELMLD